MPGERTLLNNFVGESDAPTKSAKAYLSNFVFQMLYAKANQSFMTRVCFHRSFSRPSSSGSVLNQIQKQSTGFGVFCNDFIALSL